VSGNSSRFEGSVVYGANLAFVNSTITSNTTVVQDATIYGNKLTVISSASTTRARAGLHPK